MQFFENLYIRTQQVFLRTKSEKIEKLIMMLNSKVVLLTMSTVKIKVKHIEEMSKSEKVRVKLEKDIKISIRPLK